MFSLVGNPNVGKTVLFNRLTKSNEHVGNWHGVTVDQKQKDIMLRGQKQTFVDLPGCYNLTGYSIEEKVTADFLNESQKVINICLLSSLERNLYLTLLLIEKGYKVLLFINNFESKYYIDYNLLSKSLGIGVVAKNAKKVEVEDIANSQFRQGQLEYYDNNFTRLKEEEKIKIRYKYIERLLQKSNYRKNHKQNGLDKVLLHPVFCLPIFLVIVASMFYICFGKFGSLLSELLDALLELVIRKPITSLINSIGASQPICALVIEGVLPAFTGLISFLPQIILVSICINVLEDSGYLSRIAFMFEGILSKLGLSGKSIFSLLVSFGCNTTAVFTTSSQEDVQCQKKLAMLLPFVCCSAKLPIFVIFTKLLSDNLGFIFVILLYMITFSLGCAVTYVSNKYFIISNPKSLILELGEYHIPSFSKCIKGSLDSAKNFFVKIGTTIFIVNIIIWFLQNFTFGLAYDSQNSMLKAVCKFLSSIFAPIGLNNWGIVACLISGVVAKELVLTTLAMVSGVELADIGLCLAGGLNVNFTPLTLFVFILFVSLYSPCISTLGAISKNIGKKYAIYSFLVNTLVAYLICALVYCLGLLVIKQKVLLVLFILIGLVVLVIFLPKKFSRCQFCKNKNCPKNTK